MSLEVLPVENKYRRNLIFISTWILSDRAIENPRFFTG